MESQSPGKLCRIFAGAFFAVAKGHQGRIGREAKQNYALLDLLAGNHNICIGKLRLAPKQTGWIWGRAMLTGCKY